MESDKKKKTYQHTTAKIHPDTWDKMQSALKKKRYPTKNNLINIALANELKNNK